MIGLWATQKEGQMKKLSIALLIVSISLAACGGGGGSEDNNTAQGDPPISPSGASYAATEAQTTSQAVSNASTRIMNTIFNSQVGDSVGVPSTNSLVEVKDSRSLTVYVYGNSSGSCSMDVLGTADLNSDPASFSLNGDIVCNQFKENLPDVGLVTLDGTISLSFTGTVKHDGSNINLTSTVSLANLTVVIGSTTFTSVAGSYTLSITGSISSMTITESGTIGGQTVSRTYTYSYDSSYSGGGGSTPETSQDACTEAGGTIDDLLVGSYNKSREESDCGGAAIFPDTIDVYMTQLCFTDDDYSTTNESEISVVGGGGELGTDDLFSAPETEEDSIGFTYQEYDCYVDHNSETDALVGECINYECAVTFGYNPAE